MAAVTYFHDRFDPRQQRQFILKRPMTVRRMLARRRELRVATSLQRIDGPNGRRRVRAFNRPHICFVNSKPVLQRDWSRIVVGPADIVTFVAVQPKPEGTGGGGGGSNAMAIVAALAIAVLAPGIGWALGPAVGTFLGIGAALATSITTAVAGVALGAIAGGIMSLFAGPPPVSPQYDNGFGGAAQASPTYSFGAQGNTARLGSPIPVLHGEHRIFFDRAMPAYSTYTDNKQYLHLLMVVSQGVVGLDQLKVGDTPVSSFKSIEWEKIEPGATVPVDLVDTRMLICSDISDTELPDADEGSDWKGPFALCPPGTRVNAAEFDLLCPRGLFKTNGSGGFDSKSFTVEFQVREIDDAGAPVGGGSWTDLDSFSDTKTDNTPQRYTVPRTLPSLARWEAQVRRTDTKDDAAYAGHQVDWIGLRGRTPTARTYPGITMIAVKAEATGDLNGQTAAQFNGVAIRHLPVWDAEAGAFTEELAPTRSLAAAFADIARNQTYGGKLPDNRIALEELFADIAELDEAGWTFDFVWDTRTTVWEALGKVTRAAIAERVIQGGKLRLVRDVANTAPVMMFSPRNTRKRSVGIEWQFPDETTADAIKGVVIDTNSWKPRDLPVAAFSDSPQANIKTMPIEGVVYVPQAWAIIWYLLKVNRYRRRVIGWGTEMEGLLLFYGNAVRFSTDIPGWGQSAEVEAWDAATRTLTVSEPLTFTAGVANYIALRDKNGDLAGVFEVTAGAAADQVVIDPGDVPALPEILTGGDRERTYVQFGPGEAYAVPVKVIGVVPRDHLSADVLAIDDDPRVYEAPPAMPDVPIGVSTEPLEIHITEENYVAGKTLRDYADDESYSGLAAQQVTIYVDEGVEMVGVLRGSWPPGAVPKLVFDGGTLSGATGAPGAAGAPGADGGTGGMGGAALTVLTGAIEIGGTGTIRGGPGGGGGGGGGGSAQYTEQVGSGEGTSPVSHSLPGGAGGAGNGGAGSAGTDDGRANGGLGGDGGDAGAWASAGEAGEEGVAGDVYSTDPGFTGIVESPGGNGGAGGPAGRAINGIANVTWTPGHSVTVTGATA